MTALRSGKPGGVTNSQANAAAEFTQSERTYIRRELALFFTTLPTVAEGFQLKTWRTGPNMGEPKLPPAAKSLVDRGLMQVNDESRPPRLYFTNEGIAALRRMMANPRLADPQRFAHVRHELRIDRDAETGRAD